MSNNEPNGWRLVPVEPTAEMLRDAHDAEHCGNAEPHFRNAYRAMLAAAPQPPAAQQGEAVAQPASGLFEPVTLADVIDALNVFNRPKPSEDDGPWEGGHFIRVDYLPAFINIIAAAWFSPSVAATQPAAAPQPVAQGDVAALMDLADQYARSSATAHVESLYGTSQSYTRECTKRSNADRTALHNAIAALAAAPAGVVGEPVASIYITPNGEREMDDWRHDLPVGRNILYTAPPARQALTDEQIRRMWFAAEPKDGRPASWNYARAIERACAEAWGVTLVGIGGKGGAA